VTREEFFLAVQNEFSLGSPLTDQTDLSAELGFDSLDMIDLVTFIEEIAGVQPGSEPTTDYPKLATGGEAFAYFESVLDALGTHPADLAANNGALLS
jgi:acyl carrier protein